VGGGWGIIISLRFRIFVEKNKSLVVDEICAGSFERLLCIDPQTSSNSFFSSFWIEINDSIVYPVSTFWISIFCKLVCVEWSIFLCSTNCFCVFICDLCKLSTSSIVCFSPFSTSPINVLISSITFCLGINGPYSKLNVYK
jgi:hypothetical protein